MERCSQSELWYPQLKLEMTLVDAYLHQLGAPTVSAEEAQLIFEDQKMNIETLLSSEEGRDALLPNLVRRPNISSTGLAGRRNQTAERLAILFDQEATIEKVAAAQGTTEALVRTTLMGVFRRCAVVCFSQPELLGVPTQPFNHETIWEQAPTAAGRQIRTE